MYMTNRTPMLVELLNSGMRDTKVNFLKMIRTNVPEEYNLYGYHNILSMGEIAEQVGKN